MGSPWCAILNIHDIPTALKFAIHHAHALDILGRRGWEASASSKGGIHCLAHVSAKYRRTSWPRSFLVPGALAQEMSAAPARLIIPNGTPVKLCLGSAWNGHRAFSVSVDSAPAAGIFQALGVYRPMSAIARGKTGARAVNLNRH